MPTTFTLNKEQDVHVSVRLCSDHFFINNLICTIRIIGEVSRVEEI